MDAGAERGETEAAVMSAFAQLLARAREEGRLPMGLTFDQETAEDLEGYQVHPLHVAVANEVIKPAACDRACFDYEY